MQLLNAIQAGSRIRQFVLLTPLCTPASLASCLCFLRKSVQEFTHIKASFRDNGRQASVVQPQQSLGRLGEQRHFGLVDLSLWPCEFLLREPDNNLELWDATAHFPLELRTALVPLAILFVLLQSPSNSSELIMHRAELVETFRQGQCTTVLDHS